MIQKEKCKLYEPQKDNLRHPKRNLAVDEVIEMYQKAKHRLEATQKALLK